MSVLKTIHLSKAIISWWWKKDSDILCKCRQRPGLAVSAGSWMRTRPGSGPTLALPLIMWPLRLCHYCVRKCVNITFFPPRHKYRPYKFLKSQDIFPPKIGLYFCWLLQKLCPLLEDGCTLHVFEVFLSKFLRKMLSLLGYCSTCGFPARKLSLPKVRAKAFLCTSTLTTGPKIIIK